MKSNAVFFWIAVLFVAIIGYGSWSAWKNLHAEPARNGTATAGHAPYAKVKHGTLPVGKPLKEFSLTERSGREFHSQELKGQVWVGSFFFAACPSVCWKLNQNLADLQKDLKKQGGPAAETRFISITCDPTNDTPEALQRYAARFHADRDQWLFLTGDMPDIKRIGQEVFLMAVDQGTHSERALVIGRDGGLRGVFNGTDAGEVAELKKLLVELSEEESPETPAE